MNISLINKSSLIVLFSFSANQLLNLPGKSKVPIHYCVIEVNYCQTVIHESQKGVSRDL